MKLLIATFLLAVLVGIVPVFGLFGNPVLAQLTGPAGASVFDSLTGTFGDCVAITTAGTVGDIVVSLVANPASTNNSASVRAAVYAAPTGVPGTSCVPTALPLTVSSQIPLTTLTTSLQQFTFSFGAGAQQAFVSVGQVVYVAIIVDDPGAGSVSVGIPTLSSGAPSNQNRVTCGTAGNTELFDSNFAIAAPATNCGSVTPCSTFCNQYTLDGITPQQGGNNSPSPYGTNPVVYPCCNSVTQNALQGSSLRAPDVDSAPLIWLFFLLLALTLGSYLVINAFKKRKNPRQYEIAI